MDRKEMIMIIDKRYNNKQQQIWKMRMDKILYINNVFDFNFNCIWMMIVIKKLSACFALVVVYNII